MEIREKRSRDKVRFRASQSRAYRVAFTSLFCLLTCCIHTIVVETTTLRDVLVMYCIRLSERSNTVAMSDDSDIVRSRST